MSKYDKEYQKKYRESHKEYYKKYYQEHKEKIKEQNKQRRLENYDYYIERERENYIKNHSKKLESSREWKKRNREKIRQYEKNKNEDKLFHMKVQTRKMIRKSFDRKNYNKNSKTQEILGCSYEIFIEHLLQTYKNNYGYEWDYKEAVHIDHIIPLSSARTEGEVLKLCYYTNLQLLKEKDNLKKGCKLNWQLNN